VMDTLEGSKILLGDLEKKSIEVSEIPIIMIKLGNTHSYKKVYQLFSN
jgi:hypothetical protein